MTIQDRIKLLRDQVRHNRIEKGELYSKCEKWKLDLYEDILFPIGYNTCDRCGEYGDSELDFLWVDSFDWEENNPDDQSIIKALEIEGIDYCAICWDCVKKLKEKGGKM